MYQNVIHYVKIIIGETMKRKNDLMFILTFVVIVGITLVYLFQTSYAKYRRQTEAEMEGTIASWNIKVNDEAINTQSTLTNTIIPAFYANNYVKAGTIAPGSSGYFDIIIDATNVDVDFNFTITGSIDEDTPLTDLVLKRYAINDGTAVNYNSTNGITGTIIKNTPETKVRIFFEWDDSATNTMNNQQDTEYALNDEYRTTKVNVEIHFQQRN